MQIGITKTEKDKQPKKAPLVSVIIPAYKASTFIRETLDSVLAQTFTDCEVIVINDGSPDTDELERALEPYENKIEYLKQPNRGAAAARNAGLRIANGEFIAFLDADDRWLPNYLDEQLKLLKESKADVAYADALIVGDPKLSGATFMQLAPSRCEVSPESLLAVDVGVLTSAVVARKSSIEAVGLLDETIRRGHDFDLWLRLAQNQARFVCNRKVLLQYTVLGQGLSGNSISQLERRLELLETIQARGGLTETEEAALLKNYNECKARLALETGKDRLAKKDFSGALEAFTQARKLTPSWKLFLVCFGLRLAPGLFRQVYQGRSTAAS